MNYSLPDSSVHRVSQARILEWAAIPSCRRYSQPRHWTQVSYIAGIFYTTWATSPCFILHSFYCYCYPLFFLVSNAPLILLSIFSSQTMYFLSLKVSFSLFYIFNVSLSLSFFFLNDTHLFSSASGVQKSTIKVLHSFQRLQGRIASLPFSVSRGCFWSLACGPSTIFKAEECYYSAVPLL